MTNDELSVLIVDYAASRGFLNEFCAQWGGEWRPKAEFLRLACHIRDVIEFQETKKGLSYGNVTEGTE